ncbi:TIGR02594 family protein [Bradyrhizobium sp. Leo170]|uniref:TIGR02594 family protein n=1 Tax=Bradyrhizobium sp. Leo170 TaxID=1571199 RepID=UPI00102E77EC|nr:TIGR02594 family protein [Bradyrhizobium sp. Leo170]TAI61179.1 TIGR02594 family protein [Bradyrhizobium sp. Leo170]
MVQLRAFRRLLRVLALALCSTIIVVSVSPASARPHHGAGRHARAYHAGHHAKHHYAHHRHRHMTRASRWERGVAQMQAQGLADSNASLSPEPQQGASLGSSNIVDEARRHLGGNPTSRGSLWCARFMNMVLQHSGYRGTGSDMASSFARYGQRVSGPQVGAIAVMSRGRRGGHVGIITGIDAKGNPIMISGNNGNRVREAPVSRGRIYAYVMPTN